MSASTARHTAPGAMLDWLVHPLPVLALLLLVVNDHLLKPNHPGWLSGKLSDIAVLVLLPFVLLALADLVAFAWRKLPVPGRVALVTSIVGSAGLFAAIELIPLVGEAYRWGLGAAQWPVRALAALAAGLPLPALLPVQLTFDLTDLLTLPAAAAILLVDRSRRWPRPRNLSLPVTFGAVRCRKWRTR